MHENNDSSWNCPTGLKDDLSLNDLYSEGLPRSMSSPVGNVGLREE